MPDAPRQLLSPERPFDHPEIPRPLVAAPRISVIVCAFSAARSDQLLEAITSLQTQTTPAFEVLVVIDHNDNLLDWVRAKGLGVVAVASTGERGLSGARNTGVGRAQGDIVAFLDDDAVAGPDWIARLTAAYEDTSVVGVGGGAHPNWEARQPVWFPNEFGWVVGCSYRGLPERPSEVRNFLGCNMSFRREILQSTGGFESSLGRIGDRPLGCEETELCIRIGERFPDGRLLFDPAIAVSHRVPNSRARFSYFRRRCYSEGLSKSQVTRLVGSQAGLASERSYAARVLTTGLAIELRRVPSRDGAAALGRAGAILAGFASTAAGFAVGTLRRPR
jgi:O-antigen biosynthesis protein